MHKNLAVEKHKKSRTKYKVNLVDTLSRKVRDGCKGITISSVYIASYKIVCYIECENWLKTRSVTTKKSFGSICSDRGQSVLLSFTFPSEYIFPTFNAGVIPLHEEKGDKK